MSRKGRGLRVIVHQKSNMAGSASFRWIRGVSSWNKSESDAPPPPAKGSAISRLPNPLLRLTPSNKLAIEDFPPGYLSGLLVFISRSEEHTSELQSLMRISYAVFCLKKKTNHTNTPTTTEN